MRFQAVTAVVGAAFLAGTAYADDAQKVIKDESSTAAEAATSASPPLATFTVSFPSLLV